MIKPKSLIPDTEAVTTASCENSLPSLPKRPRQTTVQGICGYTKENSLFKQFDLFTYKKVKPDSSSSQAIIKLIVGEVRFTACEI